jgi:hypothetical protein
LPALAEYGRCQRDNGRPDSGLKSRRQRKPDSQSRSTGQSVVVPTATDPKGVGSSQKLTDPRSERVRTLYCCPLTLAFGRSSTRGYPTDARHLNLIPPTLVCHLHLTVDCPVSGTSEQGGTPLLGAA